MLLLFFSLHQFPALNDNKKKTSVLSLLNNELRLVEVSVLSRDLLISEKHGAKWNFTWHSYTCRTGLPESETLHPYLQEPHTLHTQQRNFTLKHCWCLYTHVSILFSSFTCFVSFSYCCGKRNMFFSCIPVII